MAAVIVLVGDQWISGTLKQAIGRDRPFLVMPEAHLLLGKGGSGSMPSSHAANWFCAAMVAYIFYRQSWRFMVPLAVLVSFSRVYNGVHYPSDVLAGAVLGAGYGAAFVWLFNWLWRQAGEKWFPLWWQKFPSLVTIQTSANRPVADDQALLHLHWLRLGYGTIAAMLLARLLYQASGLIELSEDEAYQWLWSKHLALSYYSKPPMIAWLQWLGTHVWGDTELGVRFCSPIIAAIISLLVLRFLTREADARTGFFGVLILNCAALPAVGATLMTVDPPLILFWTAAMFCGWRALSGRNETLSWCLAGLCLGLSFLSKYAALYQIICWALFFVLYRPARVHLRKPGPWLALVICLLCTAPVLIWNAQHDWITVHHVGDNAGRTEPWSPTIKYFLEFIGMQLLLLNPVFCVAMIWAAIAFWRSGRNDSLLVFLFCMGAPVFFGYALFSSYKRIFPNWIAPAVVPLFLLMIIYWRRRWNEHPQLLKKWLTAALCFGGLAVIVAHETDIIGKLAGRNLPPTKDPLRRVRAWKETAWVVGEAKRLVETEGKPVFIIGAHYGLVGQISFYLPEAKAAARTSEPLVYFLSSDRPRNQFYFWPEYQYRNHRRGQNAIFVEEIDLKNPGRTFYRELLQLEFGMVQDLGIWDAYYETRVFRRVRLYTCRDLK
jgi:hypothetical protein